jgi:hypothetical protein
MKSYHNDHSRVSRSGVMQLLKSPAHYQAWLTKPHKDTDAMRFGRVYDALITEGIEPEVCPFDNFRTKEAREWRDSHENFVKADEYEVIKAMRDALPPVFAGGSGQVPLRWTDTVTGVECRALTDYIAGRRMIDLKTTDDASERAFSYSVKKYGYDIQAAMYLDGADANGIEIDEFVFVVQEKEAPYAVAQYKLSEGTIEEARMKYRDALFTYREAKLSDEWNGYPDEIIEIVL